MASNGHTHSWSYRLTCIHCGRSARDIAGEIEPARIIDVDPAQLSGWEDRQDAERIDALAEAMAAGEQIDAVMVGEDGATLYDGHHRRAAAIKAGVTLKAASIPMSWRQHGIGSRLQDLRMFAQMTTRDSGVTIA